jgi:hypothetical protein
MQLRINLFLCTPLTGQIILDKKTKCCKWWKRIKNQPRVASERTYFKLKSMEKKIVNKVMKIKVQNIQLTEAVLKAL